MERTAIRSRHIAIVGYDESSRVLEVAFRSGGVYHYSEVPADVYSTFMGADSHGTFFEQNIKNKYPYTKVN